MSTEQPVTDFLSVCNLLYKFIRKPTVTVHYKQETPEVMLDRSFSHSAGDQQITCGHLPAAERTRHILVSIRCESGNSGTAAHSFKA